MRLSGPTSHMVFCSLGTARSQLRSACGDTTCRSSPDTSGSRRAGRKVRQSETFGAFFQRMSTGVPGPGRDLDMRRASPTRATIHEPRSTVHSPRPEILNNKRNSRLQFSGTPATGLLGRLGGQASSPISCCCNDMLSLDGRLEGAPSVPKSCRELQFSSRIPAFVHWCYLALLDGRRDTRCLL
jgi:hypothetical protein